LAIYRLNFGDGHQFVATACVNLAKSCVLAGRLYEAENLVSEAVAIDEGLYGAEHPELATDLTVYATILQQLGKLDLAEAMMRRIIDLYRKSLPTNHPQIAIGLNNLAILKLHQQKTEEAEPLLREAIAINRACLGSEHPDLATRLNNLALALRASGKLREALDPAQEALRILVAHSKKIGHPHAKIKAAVNTLGGLALEAGLPDPIVRHFINGILTPLQTQRHEKHAQEDDAPETQQLATKRGPALQSEPASANHAKVREELNRAVALDAQGQHEEAVVWYRKSAEQGIAHAQFNLGVHLANGLGCKQDEAEAVKWYREAANQGYINAVYNLAFMLENGHGCQRDLRLAFELYVHAANEKEPDSQYKIARLLLDKDLQKQAGFDYRHKSGNAFSRVAASFRGRVRRALTKASSNTSSSEQDDTSHPASWAFVQSDNKKARELLQDAASRGHAHSARLLRTLGWG
jgi:TPR repeat protein